MRGDPVLTLFEHHSYNAGAFGNRVLCYCGAESASGVGHQQPPSFVAGMAGLAPIADAGGHGTRFRAASTGKGPQDPSKRPCRAVAVARAMVESRMGAVAWGLWPTLRFPSPLIDTDMPISGIRLSDWLHRKAHGGAVQGRRSRRSKPRSP